MTDDDETVDAIVGDVWISLSDDWMGLWQIIRAVRRHVPSSDQAEVRRLTERVVCELVDRRVRVGEIFAGHAFAAWEGDVVGRVFAAWDELGHEPNVYEVAWFELPDIADAAAAQPS